MFVKYIYTSFTFQDFQAKTLLGAPGIATNGAKTLLVTKGIATNGAIGRYYSTHTSCLYIGRLRPFKLSILARRRWAQVTTLRSAFGIDPGRDPHGPKTMFLYNSTWFSGGIVESFNPRSWACFH